MTYPAAPVLCNVCLEDPEFAGLVAAAVIRDDQMPPRCVACGFEITEDGTRAGG